MRQLHDSLKDFKYFNLKLCGYMTKTLQSLWLTVNHSVTPTTDDEFVTPVNFTFYYFIEFIQ